MKALSRSHKNGHAKGFSLVELLTVITIIIILAGIVIGALTQVNKTRAKKETSVRLQRMKLGIENYASDNSGIYPIGDDVLSGPIYKALSGDFTGTGVTKGTDPEGQTYWPELLNVNSGVVAKVAGEFVIVDAFFNSFRYRSALDLQGEEVPEARNTDFDVWSLGPDGKPADPTVDSNLKNEETKDDIWN